MRKSVKTAAGNRAAGNKSPNSFGVKTFLQNEWKGYELACEHYGLKLVEEFYAIRPNGDPLERDALLMINEKGECFTFVNVEGNRTKRVSLAESVRFYAREHATFTDGGSGPGMQPWLKAIATALEKGGAK